MCSSSRRSAGWRPTWRSCTALSISSATRALPACLSCSFWPPPQLKGWTMQRLSQHPYQSSASWCISWAGVAAPAAAAACHIPLQRQVPGPMLLLQVAYSHSSGHKSLTPVNAWSLTRHGMLSIPYEVAGCQFNKSVHSQLGISCCCCCC